MTFLRTAAASVLATALCGCLSSRVERVVGVDGSGDHRVFRLGAVTRLMMEPVLWRLEDTEKINFDRPVGLYFKDPLPPEFEKVTLRMLHDGKTGLPNAFIDPWCPGDVFTAGAGALFGTDIYADFDRRADFVRRLWDPRVRSAMRHDAPRDSNMGYALMLMAVCDELGATPQELCETHLVERYGLAETSFEVRDGMRERMAPAVAGLLPLLVPRGCPVPDGRGEDVSAHAGGMLSSAADILRVCHVMKPHLARAKGIFEELDMGDGRKALCVRGMTRGGSAFVGFDPVDGRAVAVLSNCADRLSGEGLETLDLCRERPER